ncbi:hypothetical protein BXZ70DRAFT_895312 [Cristinia sonorae]|uniref:CxC5 like cysteine cluster associated with KDZ domain-containing protein n=1 Tax=Cristinia sonorae TaxID=1940300 RepID=A0A8K0XNE0_9AGAR|nr:hypothetical protein BXZ70DRAFT_895312 [Cristinia sonorae]
MDDLHYLLGRILQFEVQHNITQYSAPPSLSQIIIFLTHAACMKNYISIIQRATDSHDGPPQYLPDSVIDLLSDAVHIAACRIPAWWDALKSLVWSGDYMSTTCNSHVKHAVAHSFYPPVERCIQPHCTYQPILKKAESSHVVYFTIAHGPMPAHNVHLYCRDCGANYHYNYYVQGGGKSREHYKGPLPDIIQISEHRFVERRLIDMWINMMLYGWNSASNCALNYNVNFRRVVDRYDSLQPFWKRSAFGLRHEHVWNAFVYLCLLEDCESHGGRLELPNGNDQKERFTEAMKRRNARIQVCGLPDVLHKCNKCVRIVDRRDEGLGLSKY